MTKVFIDGSAGTTGLRIYDRLSIRKDLELIILSDEIRKDISARREALNNSDISFLCLPDVAAKEAVALLDNSNTVIIDTSTAHRTDSDWVYGFPELLGNKKIKDHKRIANPGCHASGFIALVKPLIDAGVLKTDVLLNCFSITGYSGGGKQMIAEYENTENALLLAPRQYGIAQQHKHLKEMAVICGLENAPVFCPIVAPFYSGMEVTVTLFKSQIKGNIDDIKNIYKSVYTDGLVFFNDNADEQGFLSAAKLSGRDDMEISVFGNDDRIILVARYDNLGKGASGSAIQNMNLILGVKEDTGLVREDI